MSVVTKCQNCGCAELRPIISLGQLPLCNDLRPISGSPGPQTCYPLDVVQCDHCRLVQLSYVPPREVVFPASYPYKSGATRQLRDNFSNLAINVDRLVPLQCDDLVVDIGSNDGTLLSNFKDTCRVLGVTPEDIGQTTSVPTVQAYFSGVVGANLRAEHGPARLITCTNCFAHVPDPHDFLAGVVALLGEDGAFVTESTYWLDTVKTGYFDTIYSEHARYLTVGTISAILKRHGLEVFDAHHLDTHGGSIRVWACRAGRRKSVAPQGSVSHFIREEDRLLHPESLERFAGLTRKRRDDLRLSLAWAKIATGATPSVIHGIGAPSRASTILSYCGITADDLPVIYETTESPKVGHYMPGTSIRVEVEPERFGSGQPSHLLLLSHHILGLTHRLRDKGFRGRFIHPFGERISA